MTTRFKEGTEHGEAIPEMRPWREVGWIFKDGDALAIERQADRVRMRASRVAHQCGEEPRPSGRLFGLAQRHAGARGAMCREPVLPA